MSRPVAGSLIEIVVTQVGDPLFRIEFAAVVDGRNRSEVLLLQCGDSWEPEGAEDRDRLCDVLEELGIQW